MKSTVTSCFFMSSARLGCQFSDRHTQSSNISKQCFHPCFFIYQFTRYLYASNLDSSRGDWSFRESLRMFLMSVSFLQAAPCDHNAGYRHLRTTQRPTPLVPKARWQWHNTKVPCKKAFLRNFLVRPFPGC